MQNRTKGIAIEAEEERNEGDKGPSIIKNQSGKSH
jgi:hypothetical protein